MDSILDNKQADDVIKDCLTEFGLHTHRTKITNVIDGLKPVNRRILLVQNSIVHRKASAITGSVMEKYHPHGDMSISDAVIRMAQPFSIRVTLMASDSNVGDYSGSSPAAPRYLVIGASQFAVDMYFKGIEKSTFEYIPTEVGDGNFEPKFFVPKLPMALLTANFGIGLAHKSEPPILNMQDVCNLVKHYLKLKQQYGNKLTRDILHKKLSKYLIPDFPINVLHRNYKDMISSYESGEFKYSIIVDGTMELTPSTITIKTLPYGTKPKDVWEKLGLLRKESKPNFINSNIQRIEDYSKGPSEATIILTLKRGLSPFSILDKLKTVIGFTKRWTPSFLYTMPDDRIEYLNPIKVFEYWYEERSRAIKAELRIGQRKNVEEIRKITALIKIGNNISDVVNILRKCNSVEEAYPILSKKYDLSKSQVMIIMKFQLSSIPKKSYNELQTQLNNIKENINELQLKFFNIDKQIIQDAEYFKNKYSEYCDRYCIPPDFIGYISTMGGVIQFSTFNEMISILETFSKQRCKVELYPVNYRHKHLLNNFTITSEDKLDIPKQAEGARIIATKNIIKYTVVIDNHNTIFRVNSLVHTDNNKIDIFYVNDDVISILKNGYVQRLNPIDLPVRNTIKNKGCKTDIKYVSNYIGDTFWVAYSNESNVVTFEKVSLGRKLIFPPKSITKTHILGVFPLEGTVLVNIPDNCLSKCLIQHLLIKDISVFNDNKVVIKVSSKVNKEYDTKINHNAGVYFIN
jgi:DNA gyrase/topoisomerase IV subunit A